MTFDDFMVSVMPSVNGCPQPLALDHIVKAARAFCTRTLVWQFQANTITTGAGVSRYTLQLDETQELVRVLAVEVNGLSHDIPKGARGRALARSGTASQICTMVGNEDFILSPTPTEDGQSIVTDVAVQPRVSTSYWPDDLREYVPDIAQGAIGSLCSLPRKDWTDMNVAGLALAAFNDRINTVALQVERGFGSSRQPTRFTAW